VLGLSILTNVHNPDDPQPATLEEIIDVARTSAPKLEAILHGVIAGAVRQAPAAQD